MRYANVAGRASLITSRDEVVDLEQATNGDFTCDPMAVFARWSDLRTVATRAVGRKPLDVLQLRSPSPRAAQVFAIGLNYREHAIETGATIPDTPLTFTKFSSSINDPNGDIVIDVPTADWEVELVVVVGSGGRNITEADAWSAIAGLCVGQDVSDRVLQRATQPPQFSLGKSRRGYSPFGPWLVDAANLPNRDALGLRCTLNGEVVQDSTTQDFIFSIPQIVSYLSSIVELFPGDVIYTGTPSGVGAARKPPRFLNVGDVLVSTVDGVGSITNHCVGA